MQRVKVLLNTPGFLLGPKRATYPSSTQTGNGPVLIGTEAQSQITSAPN